MSRSFRIGAAALVLITGLFTLEACDETPAAPEDASLNVLGLEDGTVTVPMKIQFREGSFVVVPSGDPRIPDGTTTEDCPVGEESPDGVLPAGFPNGGGMVVSRGTGEAIRQDGSHSSLRATTHFRHRQRHGPIRRSDRLGPPVRRARGHLHRR